MPNHQYRTKAGQHALHLRWLDEELFEAVCRAARYRHMTRVKFVTDILRRYLKGGLNREVGVCEVCRRRAALSAPTKVKGKPKTMENKTKTNAEEAPRKCRHDLQRHPGCMKADFSGHAHGPWWPASECDDPECAPGATRLERLRQKMIAETPGL